MTGHYRRKIQYDTLIIYDQVARKMTQAIKTQERRESRKRRELPESFIGTQPHVHLHAAYGCFPSPTAELKGCNRDPGPTNPNMFDTWQFIAKFVGL